jgi:transcriptional regulator with XRE-family HTH domain
MVIFRQKKIITVKSIGEELSRARKRMNITLIAVEKKLGIMSKYLKAMEENDWEIVPGEIYAKNWLRKYALHLGLNWDEIKNKYEQEVLRQGFWQDKMKGRFGVSKQRLISLPFLIKKFFLGFLILVVVVYLVFQVWMLLSAPKLQVLYPVGDFATKTGLIKILGRAEGASLVSLNGKEITLDEYGWFKVDINLNKGLNIIKIEAKKAYGRTSEEYVRAVGE